MHPSSGLPPNSYRVALDHPATAALLRRYWWRSWAFLLVGGVPLLLSSRLEVPFLILLLAPLFGVIPGLAGILRTARRGQVLRRQPWVEVHVRAGGLNLGGQALEMFLVPEVAGDLPYTLGFTWRWTGLVLHRDGVAWVAGTPGHNLVIADRSFKAIGHLRPPRTSWTRSRWSVAFTDPVLAARSPAVRATIAWRRRIRRLRPTSRRPPVVATAPGKRLRRPGHGRDDAYHTKADR